MSYDFQRGICPRTDQFHTLTSRSASRQNICRYQCPAPQPGKIKNLLPSIGPQQELYAVCSPSSCNLHMHVVHTCGSPPRHGSSRSIHSEKKNSKQPSSVNPTMLTWTSVVFSEINSFHTVTHLHNLSRPLGHLVFARLSLDGSFRGSVAPFL